MQIKTFNNTASIQKLIRRHGIDRNASRVFSYYYVFINSQQSLFFGPIIREVFIRKTISIIGKENHSIFIYLACFSIN